MISREIKIFFIEFELCHKYFKITPKYYIEHVHITNLSQFFI